MTNTETMTDSALAAMISALEVPLMVQDIVNGALAYNDDMNYTLHHMLSDMGPDDAMMAIALSVPKIIAAHKSASPLLQALSLECEHILAEYGPVLSARGKRAQEEMDENELIGILGHIPEDLESLAEMIDLAYFTLSKSDEKAAALLNIMSTQARSQQLIAEEYIEVLNAAVTQGDAGGPAQTDVTAYTTDNVIQFPGTQAR
jgi:hypothetical protein